MIELTVIVGLLIAAVIFFKTQKKDPSVVINQENNVSKSPAQQEAEVVKPQNKKSEAVAKTVVAKSTPQIIQTKPRSLLIPQDSTLARHYLTHVQSLIEQLLPPRPSDSTLKRHYNAMVAGKLEQCLENKAEMDRLFNESQGPKQAVVEQLSTPTKRKQSVEKTAIAEPSKPQIFENIPEDSMLRRHYVTQQQTLAGAN
jgi:hypothetical protein